MEFEKVKAVVVEQLGADESAVTMEASFVDDLGADSLDIVELLTTLEDEYGVTIPDEKIKDLQTIASIQETVESLIKK